MLPAMTPFGEVGRRGVRGYAARGGVTEEAYLEQLGELLTPEGAGSALVDLVRADPATTAPEYGLTWMAVVAVLVLAQKVLPPRASIDVPVALTIVGLGIVIVVAPSSVPGLTPPM